MKPRRRAPRGGLLLGLAGAMASAAIIGSALGLSHSALNSAAREVPRTLATGSPAGAVLEQPSSLGTAAAPPSGKAAGSGSGSSSPAVQLQNAVAPPLVSRPSSRAETLITVATEPALPAPQPGAGTTTTLLPSATATSTSSAGTLDVTQASLSLTPGSTGEIDLTAVGGPVSWSATVSPSSAISLSAYSGTIGTGQSVALTVTVTSDSASGSAAVSFVPPASSPQTVPVTWSPQSAGSGANRGNGGGNGGGTTGTSTGGRSGSGRGDHPSNSGGPRKGAPAAPTTAPASSATSS
jgi:hypothetical protein